MESETKEATNAVDEEMEQEPEATVQVFLDDPDEMMLNSLVNKFGEELIIADIGEVVKQRVRNLYDNKETVAQNIAEQAESGSVR